jgi:hypothetical protein
MKMLNLTDRLLIEEFCRRKAKKIIRPIKKKLVKRMEFLVDDEFDPLLFWEFYGFSAGAKGYDSPPDYERLDPSLIRAFLNGYELAAGGREKTPKNVSRGYNYLKEGKRHHKK